MSILTTQICIIAQIFRKSIVTIDITTKMCYNIINGFGGDFTQFSSRFTIATHILLCIAMFENEQKVTSNFLAGSINVNPVVVRNILGQLAQAGLVGIRSGVGGAFLAKRQGDITLLDIFKAVEKEESLFHFHENPNPACPIGRTIHSVMDSKIDAIQNAMESEMGAITLRQLLREARNSC